MLFYLILLSSALADMCIKANHAVTEVSSTILDITAKTSCPSCPYHNISEEMIMTKEFNRKTANKIMADLMTAIQQAIANKKSVLPECAPPCKNQHKSLPLLKITPKGVNPRVQCPKQFQKTHTLTKSFLSSGNQKDCHAEVNSLAGEWIENTLVTPSIPFLNIKATPEGKNLNSQCPSECSYYSTQIFDHKYDANGCSLDLTLIVDCGPVKLEAEFIGKGMVRDHLACTK